MLYQSSKTQKRFRIWTWLF